MPEPSSLRTLAEALGGLLLGAASTRGAAARSGIGAGDILLSVNGVATPHLAAFARARRLRSDGATLEIYRFGRLLTLEVKLSVGEEPVERQRTFDRRTLAVPSVTEGAFGD